MSTTTPPPATEKSPLPPEEKAPNRFEILWRRRRNLLIALLLLLLAGAVAVGSIAVFSASSVNPENTFSAGTLSIDNSNEGAAILTAADMVPGDTAAGTVTITNTGDGSGRFRVTSSNLTNDPGPNGGNLSTALDLTIVDIGPDNAPGGGDDVATPIYDGAFDAMPTIDLGSWAGGEAHNFQFTVEFRDTGAPSSGTTQDNAFQGSSTKITYTWDAVSE